MKGLARAAAWILVISIITKMLGFLRESFLAARFGASSVVDAYLVSSTVPTLISALVGNAILTAAIPILSRARETRGDSGFQRSAWSIAGMVMAVTIPLALLSWVLAPTLVKAVAPELDPSALNLAVELNRITLIQVPLTVLGVWVTSVLNVRGDVVTPVLAGLPFNGILVVSIIISYWAWGINAVTVGGVLAVGSQFVAQLPALYRKGEQLKLRWDWSDEGLQAFIRAVPLLFFSIGAGPINILVDRWFSSQLPPGTIAVLGYGQRAFDLAWGLLVIPVLTVVYPAMAVEGAKDDLTSFHRLFAKGSQLLWLMTIPAVTLIVVLSVPLTRLLYERGSFTVEATKATALILLLYGVGLPFRASRDYLTRALYGLRDSKAAAWNGLISVLLNALLNFLLMKPFGVAGIALATSVTAALSVLHLSWVLGRRLKTAAGSVSLKSPSMSIAKVAAASGLMALLITAVGMLIGAQLFPSHVTPMPLSQQILQALSLTTVGLVTFLVTARLIHIDEIQELLRSVGTRLEGRLPARIFDWMPHQVRRMGRWFFFS